MLTPEQKRAAVELFRSMWRSERPPEPETPRIYADAYGLDLEGLEQCMEEARVLESAE
jgi:hypothetical protein